VTPDAEHCRVIGTITLQTFSWQHPIKGDWKFNGVQGNLFSRWGQPKDTPLPNPGIMTNTWYTHPTDAGKIRCGTGAAVWTELFLQGEWIDSLGIIQQQDVTGTAWLCQSI
jgi:hypothetical protein